MENIADTLAPFLMEVIPSMVKFSVEENGSILIVHYNKRAPKFTSFGINGMKMSWKYDPVTEGYLKVRIYDIYYK